MTNAHHLQRLKITSYWLLIACLLAILSIGGCSTDPKEESAQWSVQRLYAEAKKLLTAGDYENAIRYYELLEARSPFERFAQQAHLETIYAYYKNGEHSPAVAEADRFIKLYPRHPYIDYAYYMKGLANFDFNVDLLDRVVPLDKSQRDQDSIRRSFSSFSELVTRFPDSKYSQDARQRMASLRDSLAQHELHVAEFYLKRDAYLAAANRAQEIVKSYQGTPAVAEALVILVKSYKIMGMDELAADALRVLRLNYPQHQGIEEVERLQVGG